MESNISNRDEIPIQPSFNQISKVDDTQAVLPKISSIREEKDDANSNESMMSEQDAAPATYALEGKKRKTSSVKSENLTDEQILKWTPVISLNDWQDRLKKAKRRIALETDQDSVESRKLKQLISKAGRKITKHKRKNELLSAQNASQDSQSEPQDQVQSKTPSKRVSGFSHDKDGRAFIPLGEDSQEMDDELFPSSRDPFMRPSVYSGGSRGDESIIYFT